MTSPIKAYKQFTVQRAYRGDSFFWGLMPQAGDNIIFEFSQPVELHGYRLRSGNYEHPSDLLYNTSVEIRPTDPERVKGTFKISSSEQFIGIGKFLTIALYSAFVSINTWKTKPFLCSFSPGEFNDLGIAEGKIDPSQFGQISAVRLVIKSASKNWVIISEVRKNFCLSTGCDLFWRAFHSSIFLTFAADHVWHRQWIVDDWMSRME